MSENECYFCGKKTHELFSYEREDENEQDLDRELILLCDVCEDKFREAINILELKE